VGQGEEIGIAVAKTVETILSVDPLQAIGGRVRITELPSLSITKITLDTTLQILSKVEIQIIIE
jgi:hypothetical protein